MKKLLIATTALVAGAGIAAADVTISGSGRFGLSYTELPAGSTAESTRIHTRLTFDLNASRETDVGATFGGQLRFRHNSGEGETTGNQARLWVAYEGLTVEVGNVNTAADSIKLMYATDMGLQDRSWGSNFYAGFLAYESQGIAENNRMGVAASYAVGDINLYASYIDVDQTADNLLGEKPELSLGGDWTNGQITIAAAYVANVGFTEDDKYFFLGAAYNFGDGNVGLNYNKLDGAVAADDATQITLYGNYTFGETTLQAYVSDSDVTNADTAYGIGARYSLGEGAALWGAYESGFNGRDRADLGVRFSF